MDKMREEFEAWCRERGYTPRLAETNCGIIIDGYYGHHKVQIAWESWQASRAALCVKLPENCKGMALTVDEFITQLDMEGVGHE